MTRNSFKRKAIIFGVMVFMSIALISTGFAAWIISTNAKGQETGNIKVGVITEKNIEVLDIKLSQKTFAFEPEKTDKEGRLRGDGLTDCIMSTTVTAYVTYTEYLETLNISLDLSAAQGVKAAADASAGYIVLPDCAKSAVNVKTIEGSLVALGAGDDAKYNDTAKYGTVKKLVYTITFEWGTKFGGVNPGLYYDKAEVKDPGNDAYVSDADMKTEMTNFRNTMYGLTEDNPSAPDLTFTVILEAIAN